MRSVYIATKRYFDKEAGNSYFASRIFVDGVEVARQPFQYGFESQDLYEATLSLKSYGVIPMETKEYLPRILREMGVDFYQAPIAYFGKREVERWGKPE